MKRKQWGGRRKHAGRKAIDPKERRIKLTVLLDPETMKKIDQYSRSKNVSRGIAVDHLVGGKNEK